MKQAFHNHELWEDYRQGMYRAVCADEADRVVACYKLLANEDRLHEAMMSVAQTWTYAAEQNLSNTSRNRQAWLGQAACCKETGAPEYVTKMAWRRLTETEQNAANAVADNIIEEWELQYVGHGKQTALFD